MPSHLAALHYGQLRHILPMVIGNNCRWRVVFGSWFRHPAIREYDFSRGA